MLNPNTSPTSANHASKVQATTSGVQATTSKVQASDMQANASNVQATASDMQINASNMQASTAPAFTITNNTLPADYEAHAQLDYARMKLDDVNHVFAVVLNNELDAEQITALLSMAWQSLNKSQNSLAKVHQYLEQP